jgi:N-acylneuraminate cytidylyltransferase
MNNSSPAVAIIPARGGSRRIERKNIRGFRGKPILAWSIEAALASAAFDVVMVSTEDSEIAAIAEEYGAEVPFRRNESTASDTATTASVLLEVLEEYDKRGTTFDMACCLYPTAPFVQPGDLIKGQRALVDSDFEVIMPVVPFAYPIWRSLRRTDSGQLVMNFPDYRDERSQDLPASFHDAGQWYWFQTAALRRDGSLMGSNTGSIVLPSLAVQDIDTEEDWTLAELKHQRLFP